MATHSLPEVILFDYGNVIEGPLNAQAFQADLAGLASEYGLSDGRALWNHFYLCDAWEQAKRGKMTRSDYWLDRLGVLGISDEQGRSDFKQRLHRNRGLRPEMHRLLRELHGRYRLAMISNSSRPDLEQYLTERRGLAGLFEVVVSSADVGLAKPDPAIYKLALDLLRIKPDQALFVDDLVRNTEAAEALEIPSIVFTTPESLRDEFVRRGILQ
jgi:putative hydrolase of the HAD superfamily